MDTPIGATDPASGYHLDSHPPHPQEGAEQSSERILIVAPSGRDAPLASSILAQAGIEAVCCANIEELCQELATGAGAFLIAEEALQIAPLECLLLTLQHQPPWSDIPLILLTTGGQRTTRRSQEITDWLGPRTNLTLLERPLHVRTLLSAIQTALRARRRQYEVYNLLQQLKRGVRQRDEFLAMLGHELRNPLAAISYAVQLMQQNELAPDAIGQTQDVIARQTQHLSRLVDDLLDVSRVTQGKIDLQQQPVDLNEVARKSVQTLETAIRAQQHQVTLSVPAAPVMVSGDPVRLEQVVTNLLMNAIKYTPARGRIDMAVTGEGQEALLSVKDNGVGIAPELLPRVFDLFAQAERSPDRAQGGLGIGLTLVHSLITMHDGTIAANSAGLGQGSEFTLRLPLLAAENAPSAPSQAEGYTPTQPSTARTSNVQPSQEPAPPSPRKSNSIPAKAEAEHGGLHILVIEDNEDSRQILQLLLQMQGHQVEVAEDGPQGLEKASAQPPQVALVDIGLPGLDGFQVGQQLRAKLGDQIYLIALTGYGQPEDRQRTREAGFNQHLVKPVDEAQLERALAQAASAMA